MSTITGADALSALARLLEGRWQGRGRGQFEGIAPFDYDEQTEVRYDAEKGLLHLLQQTWLIDAGGRRLRPSHRETGFVRALEDGRWEYANVQSGGRLEVLVGMLGWVDEGAELRLSSVLLGQDARMVQSARVWRLEPGRWAYSQAMQTTHVAQLSPHLEAELVRL